MSWLGDDSIEIMASKWFQLKLYWDNGLGCFDNIKMFGWCNFNIWKPVFGACLNIYNYEMGGAETLSTWVSVLGTHLLLNICYYQNELKEIWVVLKHFQHMWKTCVWSMSVTEHLLSWNISTIIRNLFGCQRPQWVQLFRGRIDALVFKYCQIGKQKRCIQCSNIVWKMHWNIQLFSPCDLEEYQNV